MDWKFQTVRPADRCCKHLAGVNGCIRPKRLRVSPDGPPKLLLLSNTDSRVCAGWMWSEKIDGVRMYWDGARCVTRAKGRIVATPFGLPDSEPLDGEVWSATLSRNQLWRTLHMDTTHPGWADVRFAAFDAPAHPGKFSERYAHLCTLDLGPGVDMVEHKRLRSVQELATIVASVGRRSGEGVVVRNPGGAYLRGQRRSDTAVKIKPFFAGTGVRVDDRRVKDDETQSILTFARLPVDTAVGASIEFYYLTLSDNGVPLHPSLKPPYNLRYLMAHPLGEVQQ